MGMVDAADPMVSLTRESLKGRKLTLKEAFTHGLRMGDWKYISPQRGTTPDWLNNKDVETGLLDEGKLYNLRNDMGEINNVACQYPEVVKV